ncbi:hypothetical protein ACFSJU_00145 [Paradesertivirga mongoliensis]|uniref:DoxX family protein n=1 Tax=Paradesertivirga mongoliensis TaxID=2100740 RepID=A0ABW4ZFI9_9SPHI|nr:hypothetical protein [Pedobacter mongoliensis]
MTTNSPSLYWSFAEKLAFRFAFILFSLFIVFFNNGVFPFFNVIVGEIAANIVIWLANGVLGMNYIPSIKPSGSGDTTHHYVILLFISILSLTSCLLWTLIDKKRNNYNNLFYWLSVGVRFYLGIMLIHYGLIKVIKMQFGSPDLMRLLTPYGDSSPMGLAWTFLGFSDGYNVFMGIAELLCGLLLFRRTVTIGAIIALMVSANVMAINYFFDVPVKILSTAVVIMSLFLLAPNFTRLIDLFFKGKPTCLQVLGPALIPKKWFLYGTPIVKYLFIAYCILPAVFSVLERRHSYGDGAPKLPLYGIYIVDSFKSESPIIKWDKLIIQRSTYSAIQLENDDTEYCNMSVDTVKHQLEIVFKDDLNTRHQFSYHALDSDNLDLVGTYFDQRIVVKLKRKRLELIERPFNWISEDPYNR